MDTLGKLFGSSHRVKLLRLFMFNPDQAYDRDDARTRMKISAAAATRELSLLYRIGVIKKKAYTKEIEQKRGKKKTIVKRKATGYAIDEGFEFYNALHGFLLAATPITRDEIAREIRTAGRIRLIILSGFFTRDWERRLDILIVGEKINEEFMADAIHCLEIDLGRELKYTCLSTEDFRYRYSIQDRLIRDILDYPHEIIFDKMGVN